MKQKANKAKPCPPILLCVVMNAMFSQKSEESEDVQIRNLIFFLFASL